MPGIVGATDGSKKGAQSSAAPRSVGGGSDAAGRGLDPLERVYAARAMAIDGLTAEIAGALAADGIEALVLKGPVLAEWLYPGEVRSYVDSDLMVARKDWERAVALLLEMGFVPHPSVLRPLDAMREMAIRERRGALGKLRTLAHPRVESFAGTGFARGADDVDLHCTLHGLGAEPEAVWPTFAADGHVQSIGGAQLRVPGRAALLLHVCLHAALEHEGKALEDLRRAIAKADQASWARALELAIRLDGLIAFACGLGLVPEGVLLAERLGVRSMRSVEYTLRFRGIPMAEAVNTLLSPGISWRMRATILVAKCVPRPEFMRWWSPLARRGRLGLLASYPYRWLWLAFNTPRALLAVRRGRRQPH